VAQYVVSAILHTWQNLGLHDAAVRAGEWGRQPDWSFWKSQLVELRDLTIGIVGFGRIGRRVGELANAFGMHVLAHDTCAGAPPAYDRFEWTELVDLFARSDVVTLHTPLTSGNNGFVNRSLLSKMKPTALFINAARGPLVNEQDLADALNTGSLAAAVVDTVSNEPIRPENPLLSARNILITPHLAWATLAARRRLMAQTAANIEAFLEGRSQNVVNADFFVT
jgi:glycerate dehydrogenase